MAGRKFVDPCRCEALHDDEEWVRELKRGNEQVMGDLWQVLNCRADTIRRFHDTDFELKRDAAAAAYKRVMNSGIHSFTFRGPFCGYVRQIVVREVLRRLPPKHKPDSPPPPPPPPTPIGLDELVEWLLGQIDPELNRVDVRIWVEALAGCLVELQQANPLLFEAIRLFYLEGLSARQMAPLLSGKPNNNAVYQRLLNGRLALKECLEALGFTADTLPDSD